MVRCLVRAAKHFTSMREYLPTWQVTKSVLNAYRTLKRRVSGSETKRILFYFAWIKGLKKKACGEFKGAQEKCHLDQNVAPAQQLFKSLV